MAAVYKTGRLCIWKREKGAGCAQKDRLLRCDNFSADSSWGKFATSGAGPECLKGSALIHVWAGLVPGFCLNGMFFPFFFDRTHGVVEVAETNSLAAAVHFQQSYKVLWLVNSLALNMGHVCPYLLLTPRFMPTSSLVRLLREYPQQWETSWSKQTCLRRLD